MKQVSFWPSPFGHAVVMALVAAIVSRLTLITICPVPNEMGLDRLPPILNRLRLETNYEIMI